MQELVAFWLAQVVDWPQGVAELLGPRPVWIFVAVLFVPSLLAVATRSWRFLPAVLMLNALIAVAAVSWAPGEIRSLGIAMASALILALIGAGLRHRTAERAAAQVQKRVADVDGRMSSFLDALDRRARIVEERAIELAEARLAGAGRATPSPTASKTP